MADENDGGLAAKAEVHKGSGVCSASRAAVTLHAMAGYAGRVTGLLTSFLRPVATAWVHPPLREAIMLARPNV
jgi:hypothetical protein